MQSTELFHFLQTYVFIDFTTRVDLAVEEFLYDDCCTVIIGALD